MNVSLWQGLKFQWGGTFEKLKAFPAKRARRWKSASAAFREIAAVPWKRWRTQGTADNMSS
jgi:hypothetical protein